MAQTFFIFSQTKTFSNSSTPDFKSSRDFAKSDAITCENSSKKCGTPNKKYTF